MTKLEIEAAPRKAVKEGRIGIRFDYLGKSHDGKFTWAPLGEWTEAPDWNERPQCGGGLHYQGPEAGGFGWIGSRMVVIETDGPRVNIGGEKLKSPRARILAINDMSALKEIDWESSLDLSGCPIKSLPDGLKVGGELDLSGCKHLVRRPGDTKGVVGTVIAD